MQIEIKKFSDEEVWNKILEKFDYTTLFLSLEWAEFEHKMGTKFETYGIFKDGDGVGLFTTKTIKAKRGRYIHVRHGPLINWEDTQVVASTMSFLINKAKEEGVDFIRISPLQAESEYLLKILRSYGYRQSLIHSTDAENTVVINLEQSEDEIFRNMKKTTRNMIRKAEKLQIEVRHSNGLELFNDFILAYQDTIKRNNWNAYSINYIKTELEVFSKKGNADLFVSYYNSKPISASIFIRHRFQVFYHYSGSLTQYRDIPASYLLHWTAIKYFKTLGFKLYNFWGVSPEGKRKHPWYGFSLFKRGFTKDELNFIHSQDMDIKPFAKLTHLYEFLEAKLRGYK